MRKPLSIGILIDRDILPAWEFSIIESIINSNYSYIGLVIEVSIIRSKTDIVNEHRTFAYRTYEKIDKLVFRLTSKNHCYDSTKNSSVLLKNFPRLQIDTFKNSNTILFYEKDLDEIRKYDLDVILKFNHGALNGEILKIPRYGTWSYSFGDDLYNNHRINSCSDMIISGSEAGSVLTILSDDKKEEKVLFRSLESMDKVLITTNRNKVYWRASLFVPRILYRLYTTGESYIAGLIKKFNTTSDDSKTGSIELHEVPRKRSNSQPFFPILTKRITTKLVYSGLNNWQPLINIENDNQKFSTSFSSFRQLSPSNKSRCWADPFVISKDDKFFVFVEELVFKKDKGHITVVELNKKGELLSAEKIIDKPYHMSYPFVFLVNDTWYMIPETHQNKTIELYKCNSFPNRWEFSKYIMKDIFATDTTLFFYDKKWWMFTSVDETNNVSGCGTELFLYYSDDIFTDNWISHPNNPIVSDASLARPAGRVFMQDSKIYRPSQDCFARYGIGFNINQVIKLSETEYEENLCYKVEPMWDRKLKGAHTFNFDGGLTIIDTFSYRRRFL